MNTYIALFRGINVGGKNPLPMKDLVRRLEGLGFVDVETYIQSGNAVFRSGEKDAAAVAEAIRAALEASHGLRPELIVLRPEDLRQAMAANPFPEAAAEPKTLHATFLTSVPEHPDLDALGQLRAGGERFELKGKVFYLHAPDGIGRSKLAARIEKSLGVPGTARNWRTVEKLATLAERRG